MNCSTCGKKIKGQPYMYIGFSYFCSWGCWQNKDNHERTNHRGEIK